MKAAIALVLGSSLLVLACDKKEQPSSAPAGSGATVAPAAATNSGGPATPEASASAAVQDTAAAAPAPKGLQAGEVIVAYLQDLKDEGQCAALPIKESEKAKYDEKKIAELAKMMKAKVVDKCPSENVQGTCKMMGMLVSYTGPKYTPESAKKHCSENRGKWLE